MNTTPNEDPVAHAIETMQAMQAATNAVLAALIATHPRYEAMQLHLTRLVERADAGSWSVLTPHQRHQAREMVEWLQAVRSLRE